MPVNFIAVVIGVHFEETEDTEETEEEENEKKKTVKSVDLVFEGAVPEVEKGGPARIGFDLGLYFHKILKPLRKVAKPKPQKLAKAVQQKSSSSKAPKGGSNDSDSESDSSDEDSSDDDAQQNAFEPIKRSRGRKTFVHDEEQVPCTSGQRRSIMNVGIGLRGRWISLVRRRKAKKETCCIQEEKKEEEKEEERRQIQRDDQRTAAREETAR